MKVVPEHSAAGAKGELKTGNEITVTVTAVRVAPAQPAAVYDSA